jgi:hypothetical protein
MAQRTIAQMYDSYDDAKIVVHDLGPLAFQRDQPGCKRGRPRARVALDRSNHRRRRPSAWPAERDAEVNGTCVL